jgi:hypothetical protein
MDVGKRVLSFALALWGLGAVAQVSGAEPERLYDVTASRSRVTNVAYGYYRSKSELRVRLALANGFEKYATYRDAATIKTS